MAKFFARARSSKAANKPFGEADIVYLPGFSIKNKAEQDDNVNYLNKQGLNAYKHHWSHWENGSTDFDINFEVEAIKSKLPKNEEFGIIAKSVGTLVACSLLSQINKRRVKFLVLLGIPVNDLSQDEINSMNACLRNLSTPILVIHNTQDQHGSWENVEAILKGVNYTSIVKEVEGHTYNYPSDIHGFIAEVF